MNVLFSGRRFGGFGPFTLAVGCRPPVIHQVEGSRPADLRTGVRQQCPRRPGVYGMIDPKGELIYIGKAKNLRLRLMSYFRARSRDPKAGRILQRTQVIAWEPAPSEFAALLRELELIQRWRPRFNVQGQPGRRSRAYVCLGRRPAPYLYLAHRPPAGTLAFFGPVLAGHRTRDAIRRCNDWFRLRDCPQSQGMAFADQGELFPVVRTAGCLRYEIGTCLGPCASGCTRAGYMQQVETARAFLEGKELTPLQSLEHDMAAASAALSFERAAALRDKLDSLRWLHHQLDLLRLAREKHSLVYPVASHEGNHLWYLIRSGRVEAVVRAPHNEGSSAVAAHRIEEVFLKEPSCSRPGTSEEIDSVLLVAAWFRRHPDERARGLTPDQALAQLGSIRVER